MDATATPLPTASSVHDTAETRLRAAPATNNPDSLEDVLALVDRLLRCR